MGSSLLKIGRHTVELTHPEKIIFPRDGITKGEVVAYYEAVAPWMLPLMKDHPVCMYRFPQGIDHEGFFHKDAPDFFPRWIRRVGIPRQDGHLVHYVVCNDAATLVYLANYGCLTPHLWLSRKDKPNYPDRMIFDLDPGIDDFSLVQEAALLLRDLLRKKGFFSRVMTTGSRGAHLWIPLRRTRTFDEVRLLAQGCAQELVDRYPARFTLEISKAKRKKKLFIDFLRNSFAATAVAPYAIRALDGAPVAMPVSWEQFERLTSAQDFTIRNAIGLARRLGGKWQAI